MCFHGAFTSHNKEDVAKCIIIMIIIYFAETKTPYIILCKRCAAAAVYAMANEHEYICVFCAVRVWIW